MRLLVAVLMALSAWAADPRGHWTGEMSVPNQPIEFQVDLDNPGGHWVGSISIPARNAAGIPLENIALVDGKWTFHIKGAPSAPTFTGTLSEDGKSLAGDFTAESNPVPFKLTLAGEPKVELPKISHSVPESFAGEWGGGIDAGAAHLRLILKLTNGPAGATAVLISPDQGGSEIPVSSIETVAKKLTLKVSAVGGELVAELDSAGTTLSGTWAQGGKTLPVTLKKALPGAAK